MILVIMVLFLAGNVDGFQRQTSFSQSSHYFDQKTTTTSSTSVTPFLVQSSERKSSYKRQRSQNLSPISPTITMMSSGTSMVDEPARNDVNIPFDSILNMRDLATASGTKVASGKFFRTGCVSGATTADIEKCDNLGIKVWIDLRSQTEVDEDAEINGAIYKDVMNVHYDRDANEWKLDNNFLQSSTSGKMRYFIALMSEGVIKKGVFQRLKKRAKLMVATLAPFSHTSKRLNQKMRNIFLKTINLGGLTLLNELAIEKSPEALISCLKIITSEAEHKAIGIFCTAGKDRTGLISALTLSILGATDEEIVADYILSDSVYSQLKSSAKVASLSQNDLDPDIFLRAKAPVIIDTLEFMREKFGSVDGFLDEYGFDESWRKRLIENMGKKE